MVARPLSDAPVVDSWIYQHAVRALAETGRLRFGGYTQAMPVGQTLYGLAWSRLFGPSAPSLDLSVALLGIAGALMLYVLARRCGARPETALLATGLLICNPCYLFLSFSFMTEVPFLAPLLGCHLAFACAEGSRHEQRWLWLAATLAIVAFAVRPFGGAALIGCAAALVLYERELWRRAHRALPRLVRRLAPFAFASIACAAFWIGLVHAMRPWNLADSEARSLNAFFLVPAPRYLKLWLLWPLLYLGLVLAPLALVQAALRWRRALVIASAVLAAAIVITAFEDHFVWSTPDCRCFGGWPGALTLHGMPRRLRWDDFGTGAG